MSFTTGQPIHKIGGRYGGPGRLVGETDTLDDHGYRLYNVAMKVADGYGEFVHVFPESALSNEPDPRIADGDSTGRQSFPDIHNFRYHWIEVQRRERRQQAMLQWAHDAFGGIENHDPCTVEERARRFLEEAVELCQAVGVTREQAATVADYVYGREIGKAFQEVGGVMVTLNCLAEVLGESVCKAEVAEFERVQSKSKAHFEARHRAKMEVGL